MNDIRSLIHHKEVMGQNLNHPSYESLNSDDGNTHTGSVMLRNGSTDNEGEGGQIDKKESAGERLRKKFSMALKEKI